MRRRLTTAFTTTTTIAMTMGLLGAGCVPSALEGDWFACEDDACTTLDDNGVRLTHDGRWAMLEAPGGSLEPGEAYEVEAPWGDYTFDGTVIHLTVDPPGGPDGMALDFALELHGDELVVIDGARVCFDSDDDDATQVSGGADSASPSTTGTTGTTGTTACKSENTRMKRVSDAGAVPSGPPPTATPPNVTIPPPAPGPAPPDPPPQAS